jgi:sec-independent protein translocase protein TatA
MTTSFAFMTLTPMSIIMLLILGVLLFGRKLPEMGKYLGKGIVEFKKGLRGMEDEIDAGHAAPRHDPAALEAPRPPQRVATTAPKFEDSPAAIQQPPGVQQAPQAPQAPHA